MIKQYVFYSLGYVHQVDSKKKQVVQDLLIQPTAMLSMINKLMIQRTMSIDQQPNQKDKAKIFSQGDVINLKKVL